MGREGFIKDFRQELDSDVWVMPPLYHRIWQWLKYEVNHTPNEIPMKNGTKFLVQRGQRLTSYRGIAKAIGWYEGLQWKEPNSKTVKTICDWLEKNNMITQKHGMGNRQYTLISIVNWGLYQDKIDKGVTAKKQQSNSKVTPEKQFVDINKNDKECLKNDKECKENKYREIFDYYLSLKLINHKTYTDSMAIAIKKVVDKYGVDETKKLLDRHRQVIELTKDSEYKVKVRGLNDFFSQKVNKELGAAIIYEEYLEGGKKYEQYLNSKEDDNNERRDEYYDIYHNGLVFDGPQEGTTK